MHKTLLLSQNAPNPVPSAARGVVRFAVILLVHSGAGDRPYSGFSTQRALARSTGLSSSAVSKNWTLRSREIRCSNCSACEYMLPPLQHPVSPILHQTGRGLLAVMQCAQSGETKSRLTHYLSLHDFLGRYFGGDGDNMISFAEFCIHAVDQVAQSLSSTTMPQRMQPPFYRALNFIGSTSVLSFFKNTGMPPRVLCWAVV